MYAAYNHEQGRRRHKMNGKTIAAVLLVMLSVGCSREMKKEYYPDGKLKAVLNYKQGKLDGIAQHFYENGNLKERANYRKGKRERISTTYYEDGTLKEEIGYADDKREGLTRLYDEGGRLIGEAVYRNDQLISEKKLTSADKK
jgi:antitoxin component YwqK of YwqJK toxin-antitoxin module